MSAWRSCGEVGDSEDEEISLSSESQSWEQPRKRQKLDNDGETTATTTSCQDTAVAEMPLEGPRGPDGNHGSNESYLIPQIITIHGVELEAAGGRPAQIRTNVQVNRGGSHPSDAPSLAASTSYPPSRIHHLSRHASPDQDSKRSDKLQLTQGGISDIDELPDLSEVLARYRPTTPVPQDAHDSSTLSSPLSELAETPPAGYASVAARDFNHAVSAGRDFEEHRLQVAAGDRALRARNPKQLHPYAHDRALYERQLKQSGLRPVHFTFRGRSADNDHDVEDSDSQRQGQQDNATFDIVHHVGSSQSTYSAPPSEHISTTESSRLKIHAVEASSPDEGLPDVDPLVNRNTEEAVQEGYKRRRLVKSCRLPRKPINDVFSVPPSPPPTSSSPYPTAVLRKLPEGFRLPFDATPAPLPTPEVSSNPRIGQSNNTASDSDSELPHRRSAKTRLVRRPIVVAARRELSDVESTDSDEELRKLQRRVRGVLPASWLKIDLRAQQRRASPARSPPRARRVRTASPPSGVQKGIARRITRPSATPQHRTDQEQASVLDILVNDDDDPVNDQDDVQEVDWVEPMLAGVDRARIKRSKHNLRQPRITDAFRSTEHGTNPFAEERRRHRMSRSGATAVERSRKVHAIRTKRACHQPSPPQLSILDSHEQHSSAAGSVPQFIRLAQRRARKQRGGGRHSPSYKVIRLATEAETEEVDAQLRGWREGTLVPAARPEIRRPPLADISNLQLSLMRVEEEPLRQLQADSKTNFTRKVIRKLDRQRASLYRGAQLETLEATFYEEHRAAAFERRINCLTENVARPRKSKTRLLRSDSLDGAIVEPRIDLRRNAITHRSRKRQANHIDADARQYRQPSEPLHEFIILEDTSPAEPAAYGSILTDLGPFGTRYSTDFDIRPLPVGTFFHQSTFLGSGDFAASMCFTKRNLTHASGRMRVHVADELLEWGAWTEVVAAGLSKISAAVSEALQGIIESPGLAEDQEHILVVDSNIEHMLRSVVQYCTKCLAFIDQVDRPSCVQRLQRLVEDLLDVLSGTDEALPTTHTLQTRCLRYGIIVATQAWLLCDEGGVAADSKRRSHDLVVLAAQKFLSHIMPSALQELRNLYEDLQHSTKRETGVRDDNSAVSSVVIVHHCLRKLKCDSEVSLFWKAVEGAIVPGAGQYQSAKKIDAVWFNILTLLPALEVDEHGIARPGFRYTATEQGWTVIKPMLVTLFERYSETQLIQGTMINEYLRVTLMRCFHLANAWAWMKCDGVLSIVYDFFAKRGLADLDHEEAHGSVDFLDELDAAPSIVVQHGERAFCLFLKLLASLLLNIRKYRLFSDKKTGGIVWRYIPNHGRTYLKDAEVKRIDVDALRNHHDLLCTLYYSAPPGHRLRVDVLQGLVDHARSHREACRINVRAWARLMTFQASTNEDIQFLQPLSLWCQDILDKTMTQYRLAKTEAEHDFAQARAQGHVNLTDCMLGDIISRNQRQIVATLVDLLAGLKRALKAANSLPVAVALCQGCDFWNIFIPFDIREKRLLPALSEALEVVNTALEVQGRLALPRESQPRSEDSQDYGDTSALLEFAAADEVQNISSTSIAEVLHNPLGQLLSNVFGADSALDDVSLAQIVDCWVRIASDMVREGTRGLDSFVSGFAKDSWFQLPNSEHKRKYTPYFFAKTITTVEWTSNEIRIGAIGAWLVSLVEREASLKYQHLLTSALLNTFSDEPLIYNLPFCRRAGSSTFTIRLDELRQRRLAVLSAVLSNMRESLDRASHMPYSEPKRLRMEYAELLRAMMHAMRTNFLELQGQSDCHAADPTVQGAYVDFVHDVVSLLQQHTTEICPIDGFFTDSAAFPLPASDPTYVVGKLRSYVPKLADTRARKQLAVFVHSVSERAAVDDQQEYLVSQLCSAVSTREHGSTVVPTLRYVLLAAIFPAYINLALSTASSWILARPILQASVEMVDTVLYEARLDDEISIDATVDMLASILNSLFNPLEQVFLQPGLLRLPQSQAMLAFCFDIARSSLTISDFISRSLGRNKATEALCVLYDAAVAIRARVHGTDDIDDEALPLNAVAPSTPWQDTLAFAKAQLQESLSSSWSAIDGDYFVRRGNTSKQVTVRLKEDEEELQVLLHAIDAFCASYDVVMGNGRGCDMQDEDNVASIVV